MIRWQYHLKRQFLKRRVSIVRIVTHTHIKLGTSPLIITLWTKENAITRASSSKNRACNFHRIRLKHFVTLSAPGQQFSESPFEFPQIKVFMVKIRVFIELQTDVSDYLRI